MAQAHVLPSITGRTYSVIARRSPQHAMVQCGHQHKDEHRAILCGEALVRKLDRLLR